MNEFGRLFGVLDDYFAGGDCMSCIRVSGLTSTSKGNGTEITVELPGFSKKDVKVVVEGGFLSLEADNGTREWRKTYSLAKGFDAKNIKAKMKDGIFTIFVPYKNSEVLEVEVE